MAQEKKKRRCALLYIDDVDPKDRGQPKPDDDPLTEEEKSQGIMNFADRLRRLDEALEKDLEEQP